MVGLLHQWKIDGPVMPQGMDRVIMKSERKHNFRLKSKHEYRMQHFIVIRKQKCV